MPIPNTDPIVSIPMVTPFNEQDAVDYDAAQSNVERWLSTPIRAYLVGSHSGEEGFMSEGERLQLLSCVSEVITGDRFALGGIDCPSVTETLRQAEAYASAGAEMVRVRFPRDESTVVSYFEQVLARSPVPVLLINQCDPSSFGVAARPAATPEVIGEVASMDGIYGYVTDHDVRFEARVRHHFPGDKRFWICNGSLILSGTLIGCNGTTTAFANIWPEALHQLLLLGMQGKYSEGEPLQNQVRRIDEVMLPYRGAGIKACLKLMGFQGMNPRLPTEPVPDHVERRIEQVLREARLLT